MAEFADAADVWVCFEDQIYATSPLTRAALNAACTDVSKSHVAAVFETVFGYPLAIDPVRFEGVAIEKSEENGKHDGALIECPTPRRLGRSYQRYIDTTIDAAAQDPRTCCVGGAAVIVMIKRKPANESFSIQNESVKAAQVEEVFSPEELALIARFNEAMGLDWGSLDVLREAKTGRLFIVDVNKTDVGPPVVRSWRDRVKVTRALGATLRKMVTARAVPEERAEPRPTSMASKGSP